MRIILIPFLIFILSKGQMSFDECKRDCTQDWLDCISGCSDDSTNLSSCHQNCQKVVHSCLEECPKTVCVDECRMALQQCRKNGKGVCELMYTGCELQCRRSYREDI